ncbi:MAG TPA: cyanophycin synthetase, partial [Candidatus Ozemobacteraceae bacterium]|nr:cyanophycin synthetase [Candidatus Ozemobacteraceae bacterium]
LEMGPTWSRFDLVAEGVRQRCAIHLPGPFNIFNAALASGLARTLEIPWSEIVAGLDNLKQVPGRFESIPNERGLTVIVDYAHSPASLENVLRAVRAMTSKRVISIFGCGGNRSADKRPIMGRLSASLADITIVTSDNPRKEDPQEIVRQIMAGIEQLPSSQRREVCVEVDRRRAIEKGLSMALSGDVVLIAGKGHETGQTFADRTVPFDDREVAREILQLKEGKHV